MNWIHVDDDKPKYDHDVLVAFDDGLGVYVAEWRGSCWVLCGHNQPAFQRITHWAYIPDHPNSEFVEGKNQHTTGASQN